MISAGCGTADTSGQQPAVTGCTYAKVQTLGAGCCQSHGPDACGAGLFCAAYDGRTIATCYANRSREAGQTCKSGLECLSSSCGASGLCAALPNMACEPAWGCATIEGVQSVCAGKLCHPIVRGGDYCLVQTDCATDKLCQDNLCATPKATKLAGVTALIAAECKSGQLRNGVCLCSTGTQAGCRHETCVDDGTRRNTGVSCKATTVNGAGCVSGLDCVAGFCDQTMCKPDPRGVGATCTYSTDCASANCFQGKCSCLKYDSTGCPDRDYTCTGTTHVTYGNRCDP